MHGHGRPLLIQFLVIAIVLASGFFLPCRHGRADNAIATESLPIAWQDDAELTDVCFVNRNAGWAVGAQGVILRTTDGGKTWLQPSDASIASVEQQVNESMGKLPLSERLSRMQQGPQTRLSQRNVVADATRREVRVRFESVHFIDPKHGWAAGGYSVPWIDGSRGLIMRTNDGGKTWHRVQGLRLPRVNKIHFTNRRTGWAIGETNALHPDGVFFTNDGGTNWTSQSTTRMNTWIDGKQMGGQSGLIDQSGRLAVVAAGTLKRPALFGCSREDRIDCLAMLDERNGFAVGQGGLILKTDNAGDSWKRLPIDLEYQGSTNCASINGQNIFLSPATGGMFRVGLKDRAVQQIDLPTSMPVRAIKFVDTEIGYAVGDLGAILSTSDGGQTWQKQHGDHDRLAILFVANDAKDLSLSLMAYNAGEESRLCGTILLEDQPSQQAVSVQAFERVGSAVNWQCHDTKENRRSNFLVAAIRSAKPLVVVCCHDLSSSDRYRDAVSLQTMVSQSIERAADAAYSLDHLKPWQVQRLATSDLAGPVRLDSRRMMPSLGVAVSDQIAVSRALLGQSMRAAKFSNWRVTHPENNRSMKGIDLLSGLARKGMPVPTRKRRTALGNLNRMNEALDRKKQTERLAGMTIETDQDLAAWRQTLLAAGATADEQLAGLWLMDLAQRYLESGRLEMVDHSLATLTTYWSDHAFAPAANAWLTVKRSQDSLANELSSSAREAQRRILEPFMKLTQHDPSLAMEPAWQWLELNLLARTSGLRSVEPKLGQMSQVKMDGQTDRSFATVAQQELSLLRSSGRLKPDTASKDKTKWLTSTFASARPKLDGVLDDGLWRDARKQGNVQTVKIAAESSNQDTDEIVFAHDDQFFYGAIRCRKLPTLSYRPAKLTRSRDPNLSRNDRVELTIDPSLNFCGGSKLTLDYRGWVTESKLGGKGWNPDWYVAGTQDEKTWSVEFAIPLSAISQRAPDQPIHASDESSRGWAVKVCRLDDQSRSVWDGVPSVKETVGLQASLKPAPDGFLRMIFSSNPDLAIPTLDRHVQPAQYQLESDVESNGLAAPPNVPDIGVAP